MNTIFNKIISVAVLSALTFSLALPASAAESGFVGTVFQKLESVFSANKEPVANQQQGQQPVGQNMGQGQIGGQGQFGQPIGQQQPAGQNQLKGQNQFGQPSGQQSIQGQGQLSGQQKQSVGQNQPVGQGQSMGQQQLGQGQLNGQQKQSVGQNQPIGQGQSAGQQQKGQNQFGQPNSQQPAGQGQIKGQSQFGQPSGQQQPTGQGQNFGQQSTGQGQLGGQGQSSGQQGQGQFNQAVGQQPTGQGEIKGQGQFGQPTGQGQSGNQNQFGQPMGQQQLMGQGDNVSSAPENVSSNEDKLKLQEQERREVLAEKYEKMKEQYNKAVEKHEDARKHFLELREQFNAPSSENREGIQEKMNEQAQKYLQNTVETMTQRVEMLERRVLNMPMIPVVGKEKIVAGLNNDIANLKEKLTEAKEAEDAGAIKEAAQSIRDYWQGHDLKVKQVVGYTILGNTDKMLEKVENMGTTLEKRVEELKAKGADVSKVEGYMNEYGKLLDMVGQKRTEAETQFNSLTSNVVSGVEAFHNGMKTVQDIKKLFGDVRDEMKNAVQEIKSLAKFEAAPPAPEEEKTLEEGEKNAE